MDHVIEVGGPGTLAQSIRAARVGGHIALIGALSQGLLDMTPAIGRQITIKGLVVGSTSHQKAFVRAIESLDLHPVIDRVFSLDGLAGGNGSLVWPQCGGLIWPHLGGRHAVVAV